MLVLIRLKQDRLFLSLLYSLLSNQTNDHNLFSLIDNENERKTVALMYTFLFALIKEGHFTVRGVD